MEDDRVRALIILLFALLFLASTHGCGIKLEGIPRQFQLVVPTPTPTCGPQNNWCK